MMWQISPPHWSETDQTTTAYEDVVHVFAIYGASVDQSAIAPPLAVCLLATVQSHGLDAQVYCDVHQLGY